MSKSTANVETIASLARDPGAIMAKLRHLHQTTWALVFVGALCCFQAFRTHSVRTAEPPALAPWPNAPHEPCSTAIPKIIHQSYISMEALIAKKPAWKSVPAKWKKTHPEFEYKFWSDADNRALVAKEYPWFLPTYDAYTHPIQRADAARYFAVHHYGGIYVDLDIVPERDMTVPWLCRVPQHGKAEMLVAQTPNLGLTNMFFGSVPKSKALTRLIKLLPTTANKWRYPYIGVISPYYHVMMSAGSTRYSITMRDVDKDTFMEQMVPIPVDEWGLCSVCQRRLDCGVSTNPVVKHVRGNSWHNWDAMFLQGIFCHVPSTVWGLLAGISYYVLTRRQAIVEDKAFLKLWSAFVLFMTFFFWDA